MDHAVTVEYGRTPYGINGNERDDRATDQQRRAQCRVGKFPEACPLRFRGAPPIIKTTRTHEMPDFNNGEADIMVETRGTCAVV